MRKKAPRRVSSAIAIVIAFLAMAAGPASAASVSFVVQPGSFIRINDEVFDVGTDPGDDPNWAPPVVVADVNTDPNDPCVDDITNIQLNFNETDIGSGVTAQVLNGTGASSGTGDRCTGDATVTLNVRVALSGTLLSSGCAIGGPGGFDVTLTGSDYDGDSVTLSASGFNVPAVTNCGFAGNLAVNGLLGLPTTDTEALFILEI